MSNQKQRRGWGSAAGLIFGLVGVASLLNACSDGDAKPAHLDVAASNPSDDSTDEWLRKKHLLRMTRRTADGKETVQEVAALNATSPIFSQCWGKYEFGPTSGNSCYDYEYSTNMLANMCIARSLLALANVQSDSVQVPDSSDPTVTLIFDHVTEANAADLATQAADFGSFSVWEGLNALSTRPSSCISNGNWVADPHDPTKSMARDFAASTVEAYYLVRAAYDRAVEANLNVSDEARSSTSSVTEGVKRADLGSSYSRAAAAHLLVGGDDGMLGTQEQGFCVGPDLTPQAKSALSLLRAAAPNPALLRANDMDALLQTGNADGSVRERLGQLFNISALTSGQSPETYYDLNRADFQRARDYLVQEMDVFNRSSVAAIAGAGFKQYTGSGGNHATPLPRGAWSARANWWKQPKLCKAGDFGCHCSGGICYSSINRLVDMTSTAMSWRLGANGFNPTDVDRAMWMMPPLNFFVGQTAASIRNLMKSTDNFATTAGTGTPESKEVLGSLATIISGDEYKGAIEYTTNTTRFFAYAHGYADTDKVRVVVGEDGLRCAVEGTIEGASCKDSGGVTAPAYPCANNATNLACLTLHKLTGYNPNSPWFGMTFYTGGGGPRSINTQPLVDAKTRLYWVKLKNQNLTEEPGNFELLGGTTLEQNVDHAIPIIPTLDSRVDRVLAPDTKRCFIKKVNCLDKEFDARLPLEDELTDNGDGVENSWRHYLDLAKQAAQESDTLGQEFVQAKLNKLQSTALAEQRQEEQKQAGEQAIQEVQAACGTALDSRKLLTFFSGGSDNLSNGAGNACDSATPCSDPSMSCVAGRCVVKLERLKAAFPNDADADRLVSCIDDSAGDPTSNTVPFVTLGDKDLCVYVRASNPNDICPQGLTDPATMQQLFVSNAGCIQWAQNSDTAAKCTTNANCPAGNECSGGLCQPVCPAVATTGDAAALGGHVLAGIRARKLSYFENTNPPVDSVSACTLFRRARGTHTPAAVAAVANTGVFNAQRFSDTVGQLGFNGTWGGYWALTENGGTRYTSGNVSSGDNTLAWPFQPSPDCLIPNAQPSPPNPPMVVEPSQQNSLLCSTMPANPTAAQRGAFTSRVARAAFAATMAREVLINSAYDPKHGIQVSLPTIPLTDLNQPNGFHCSGTSDNSTIYKITSAPGVTPVVTAPIRRCGNALSAFNAIGTGTVTSMQGMAAGTDPAWIMPDGSLINGKINFVGPGDPNRKDSQAWVVDSQFSDDARELFELGNGAGKPGVVKQMLLGDVDERSVNGWTIIPAAVNGMYPNWMATIVNPVYGSTQGAGDSLLDGLELLCELDRSRSDANTQPPVIKSVNDLDQAGAYLQKLADQITRRAANKVFARVPKLASDTLGTNPPTGVFPALGGDMADAVIQLRKGMESARDVTPTIANEVRAIGSAMGKLRAELDKIDATKEVADLDMWSTISSETATCAAAAGDLTKDLFDGGLAAAATCANSFVQMGIAIKKKGLDIRMANDDAAIAIGDFNDTLAQSTARMQEAATALDNANEDINAALARIDSLRQKAKVSIAHAVYLASHQSAAQAEYDGAVGAMSDLAQNRYKTALKNAKLMAFFAKRAIEQRLGIELSSITSNLPLVEAPQSWEGNVCSMGGLQTTTCGAGGGCGTSDNFEISAVYGDGFVGEYVDKLERTVESYRLVHNFKEGKDVAVISMRDDVANVRVDCQVPAKNLLDNSGDLTNAASWVARTCNPITISGVKYNALNCISAVPSPDWAPAAGAPAVPDLAVPGKAGSQTGAQGYILQFGDGGTCSAVTGGCGWKTGSALTQIVTLKPGRYRFSWYTRDSTSATNSGAKSSIVMLRGTAGLANPTLVTPDTFTFPTAGTGSARWQRASVEFLVATQGDYEVGFGSNAATRPTEIVTVGAPMLEAVPNNGGGLLPAFQLTDAQGLTTMQSCEDTHGDVFREKNWTRQCVQLCDTGFSSNCADGPEHCYREYSFGVSQGWIQNGKLFNYSGFARGNFNYRIDSLALNFVGSKVRSCADSSLPDTCYNAGFVPYSIYHTGPFFIRTDEGKDFETLLFDGHIEHARGLALERYVTNPISSTDQDLLKDYYRSEFAGRPLDGNFVVRMWEEPGVNLDAIEDIQLVLNYRYWTSTK